jgi:serine/threonine-protein kinase
MTSSALQTAIEPQIGRYSLVAELARGGMGNVYLAAIQGPAGFSKLVVVKELKPELIGDEAYVTMFLDEARLAARLNHPNIVQTYEVGSDGDRHYLVMEFLDGRSLHRIAKRLGDRFPVAAHLRVIAEALLGLHYAHEMREFDGTPLAIVHRDVSPLNVFVTFAGQTKVLDFGIAKTVDSSQETKMGILKGRVAYMAPEQARGAQVDRRADVYSAGVMLWEAVARRRLWAGYTEVEILTELLRERPRPLKSVCPDVPEDLDRICSRAMAYDRQDRYPDAAHLLQDLEGHLARRRDAMSMRDVAAFISRAFEEERDKMNAVIDEALARVRGAPRSGVMPIFSAQPGTPTATNAAPLELAKPSVRLFTPGQSFSPNAAASSLGSLSRSAPATSATRSSARTTPHSRTGFLKNIVFALACAGALLFGVSYGGRLVNRERQVFAPPAPVLEQRAPTKSNDAPELVDVAVRANPASAQISIDGAPVAGNPFHARRPKEGRIHHIVVSADGYESRTEDVSYAANVFVDLSLNRRTMNMPPQPQTPSAAPVAGPPRAPVVRRPMAAPPTSSSAAPEAPAAAPPAATKTDITAAGGHVPLRPISTSNPYGTP